MNTEYRRYLKSNHWKDLKKAAISYYGARCNFCGSRNNIEIHHLRYASNLYLIKLRDVIPLCNKCHSASHTLLGKLQYLPRELKNGFVHDTMKKTNLPSKRQKATHLKIIDKIIREENQRGRGGFESVRRPRWVSLQQ